MEQFFDPIVFLSFPIILFSLSVHECAHAFFANMGGDDTGRLQGRITLNPLSHIDPFGTIIVPILLTLAHAPVLGWARPVQVNLLRLKKPYWDVILTAAGPLSNLALALLAFLIGKATSLFIPPAAWHPVAHEFIRLFIGTNVLLFIFNLMPIPPLDGSRIFFHYFVNGRPRFYPTWAAIERYSFIFLYLFIILKPVQEFLGWATIGLSSGMFRLIGI